MSIASEIGRISRNIASAYEGCRNKNADMPQTLDSASLRAAIDSIPTADDTVIFYDYDGTRLYSYSRSAALGLAVLPEAPSHEGLITRGWNWTLAEIKESVQRGDTVDVGCLFTTQDGKTHFYISLTEDKVENLTVNGESVTGIEVRFAVGQTAPNSVVIDWGDGSGNYTTDEVINSLNNDTNYRASHIYITDSSTVFPLCYTISLYSESYIKFGQYYGSGMTDYSKNISDSIIRAELTNCLLNDGAFQGLSALKTMTFEQCRSAKRILNGCSSLKCAVTGAGTESSRTGTSGMYSGCSSMVALCTKKASGQLNDMIDNFCRYAGNLTRVNNLSYVAKVTSYSFTGCSLGELNLQACTWIEDNAFSRNYSLTHVKGMTNCTFIGYAAFQECFNLKSIDLMSAETISSYSFNNCIKLRSLRFSANLRSIGAYAFRDCREVRSIVLNGSCTIGQNAFYSTDSALEWVDLTAYTSAESIPTLSAVFTSVFPTVNRGGRRIPFYVANEQMKTAFSQAENWSAGADNFVVGAPNAG